MVILLLIEFIILCDCIELFWYIVVRLLLNLLLVMKLSEIGLFLILLFFSIVLREVELW